MVTAVNVSERPTVGDVRLVGEGFSLVATEIGDEGVFRRVGVIGLTIEVNEVS